ncbi:hypothetical protein [Streptomyces collinus]|uniref:hypothetical protein n=1 Tax=Streptomyces collinus TaxID=42684 RepID=UPI003332E63E
MTAEPETYGALTALGSGPPMIGVEITQVEHARRLVAGRCRPEEFTVFAGG